MKEEHVVKNVMVIKGTTIWIWGGGGLALSVGTDYLFSLRARLENLFPGKSRTEYLFSTATIFLKSKEKKGGWGSARVK